MVFPETDDKDREYLRIALVSITWLSSVEAISDLTLLYVLKDITLHFSQEVITDALNDMTFAKLKQVYESGGLEP